MVLQIFFQNIKPRNLFLLDGLGAFLSAFMLGFVLITFEPIFGMPRNILNFLAFIALLFSVYSFTCYKLNLENWRPYLKAIAYANITYCFITALTTIYFYNELTLIGILYFIGEILIILLLSMNEIQFSNSK